MKHIVAAASLLTLISSGALATEKGYRDCTLHNLAACENSNQLFWAEVGKSGKTVHRQEFHQALVDFMRHAPPLYIGKTRFDPAQIASNSFVGPGDHHDHLPGGGWLFDGFTPHDAPERCAIVFSADGKIALLALLDVEMAAAEPDTAETNPNVYYLHLYSHVTEPDRVHLQLLRTWADDQLKSHETVPQSRLGTAELFTQVKDKWTRRALP